MQKKEIELHLATVDTSLVEAMRLIQKNADGIIFIVDKEGKLLGSITDGDVRRWLINTGNVSARAEDVMFRNTKYIHYGRVNDARQFMRENKVLVVPVVSDELRIVDIIVNTDIKTWRKPLGGNVLKDVEVIIMAGGEGTRLRPYTKILPKPLIPVGDIPIIERIINKLGDNGAESFYIILNYKRELIKAYFYEQNLPYKIHFIDEEMPLGTAGGIRLINKDFCKPVLVTNCDILIEVDYSDMINQHLRCKNDMTIVAALKKTIIPYGVLHSQENGTVISMDEKPEVSYLINTGMYFMNPESIKKIPKDEMFHMPWLAQKIINQCGKVGIYPVGENSFLDMGEFEEMKKMEERLNGTLE